MGGSPPTGRLGEALRGTHSCCTKAPSPRARRPFAGGCQGVSTRLGDVGPPLHTQRTDSARVAHCLKQGVG
eukprot:11201794-Alexandrium_andersonii.AAC.1